jgi:hypothetical protein
MRPVPDWWRPGDDGDAMDDQRGSAIGLAKTPAAAGTRPGGEARTMNITTTRNLLTPAWNEDVEAMDAAIRQFASPRAGGNDCHVAFFEVQRDRNLHVNVTHRRRTRSPRGWAGPAARPEGFVHNRRFDDTAPARIIRSIREMVFAAPK